MNFVVIYILFWLYSFLGWVMETVYVSILSKEYKNRGFLLGPYCPIYGSAAILLLTLRNYQDSPLIVFIVSIFVCSLLEYITSYLMELVYKVRWWDYSDKRFNLNGRICLFNSVCFGLLGMILVCYLNPFFIDIITNCNKQIISIIALIILIITMVDIFLTISIMYDIRKTVINYKEKTLVSLFKKNQDMSDEISKNIRKILKERSFIHRHLSKSYSNLKVYKNNFFKKTEELIKDKRLERQENNFIVGIFISVIIGFIIGKIFNNIGLFVSIFVVLGLLINKIIDRRNNGK